MRRFRIENGRIIVAEPDPKLTAALLKLYCNWQQFKTISEHAHRNIVSQPRSEFYTAHLLLERIYTGADAQLDLLGEHIRGYGVFLPDTLGELAEGATLPTPPKGSGVKPYLLVVISAIVALHDNLIEVASITKEPELLGTNTLIGDLMLDAETWLYLMASQLHMEFTAAE